MTPTHNDLVEALREAREAINNAQSIAAGFLMLKNCGHNPHITYQVDELGCHLNSALSKINPILNELEE